MGLDARSVHRTTASLFQSNRAQTLPVFLLYALPISVSFTLVTQTFLQSAQ